MLLRLPKDAFRPSHPSFILILFPLNPGFPQGNVQTRCQTISRAIGLFKDYSQYPVMIEVLISFRNTVWMCI
ncbi:hypothetical protein GDO81_012191 [Engystomops pustulosus]|uniref:Uncharacterized protein n=1 Tax=Engystomops pustulosus TaxID=76066 RepID=A0AAV7BK12_ENGPU|nr:hypothetical protein GDO81_012191 [Engystomops pustulosus]